MLNTNEVEVKIQVSALGNESTIEELEKNYRTEVLSLNESLEKVIDDMTSKYYLPVILIPEELCSINTDHENGPGGMINSLLIKYRKLFEHASKLAYENAKVLEKNIFTIDDVFKGKNKAKNDLIEKIAKLKWARVNQKHAFDDILCELREIGGECLSDNLHEYYRLTLDIMSIFTDPEISSKLDSSNPKTFGKSILKLNQFFDNLRWNDNLINTADAYDIQVHGEELELDELKKELEWCQNNY